ncbi:putative calcium-binding mitochondrial carrier [Symbiodinium microadriaticum]|uniref:Putative calcium-binding mitochondrial carrier n=1 Tax=Symbiodinium microadriaticum TaxID=2951 RepID=A0A1Q9DUI9_SYMMI|nr:putative calcium-binding mitochondrial carrier [Symbiodinium microadriaticum]
MDLVERARAGCTEDDFQKLYDRELAKVSANLAAGEALNRDPKYAVINRQDCKKFDKRLNGQIRATNWVTTSAELAKALGGLQIEDAFNPPDLVERILSFLWGVCWLARDGGPGAFWQGNGANVLKVMPESAVKFLVYDKVTKTRLAAAPSGTYSGILDCLQRTVEVEGFRALYKDHITYRDKAAPPADWTPWITTETLEKLRLAKQANAAGDITLEELQTALTKLKKNKGIWPALLAIVPASGIDLAVYNTLKAPLATEEANYEQPRNADQRAMPLTSGPSVGRTRLIVQGMPGRCDGGFGGKWRVDLVDVCDCIRKILANSGFQGLYRGLTPALFKTIPAVSIGWAAFEFAKSLADTFLPLSRNGSHEFELRCQQLWKLLLNARSTLEEEAMSSGSESPVAEPAVQEYRIYKEMILKPLSVESLQAQLR